jgi:nitroimidazol reductase NimA-like FMN-containing flavoprotein (pyridoxamine 5'-phosphate oxidase superfamily)
MPDEQRRGVRMTAAEAWAFLAEGHTGILTTLRQDGYPIALPVWFAVVDRVIYVSTRGKKIDRVRRDQRCSFLVEDGLRWAELRAVHLTADASVVDELDAALAEQIRAELERKYAEFRTATSAMSSATRSHYANGSMIRLVPHSRVLTWDNNLLRLV